MSGRLILEQPAMKLFLREVGIDVDPFNLEDFKKACEQANPRYQGGKDLVRFQLEQDETGWPVGTKLATLNLARSMGMTHGETPLTGEWDVVIALGGARRSPLDRACYAAQSVLDTRAAIKLLVVAGSTRTLNDAEKTLVQDYAPGAETEYDLCIGAASFVQKRHPELTNVVTVCKDDPRSGNDGVIDETMAFCAGRFNGQIRAAAVSTRIYVRGLELDMARAAKRHGWRGYGAAGHASGPETIFGRTISTYLSECLTTAYKAAIAAAEGC